MALSRIPSAGTTGLGRRNLIINGGMQVAQRGTQNVTGDAYTALDRFKYDRGGSIAATFATTQDSDAPDGFGNSLKFNCTTADTPTSSEHTNFRQVIEAQNLQHLKYGTSEARATTLSFWVKASQTATYSVALYQTDGARVIGSTYTISATNTWEYKTITFAGDTGGTINDDNGAGLEFIFALNVGSDFTDTDNTSWGAYSAGKFAYGHTATIGQTSGDYLFITGVQYEVGSTATDFEHRSYGEELTLCQRYFERFNYIDGSMIGVATLSSTASGWLPLYYFEKRIAPSFTSTAAGQTSGTLSLLTGNGSYPTTTGSVSSSNFTSKSMRLNFTGYSGLTGGAGYSCVWYSAGNTFVDISAEL